jgi:hypothetical protein
MNGDHRPWLGARENARFAKAHGFKLRIIEHGYLDKLAMLGGFSRRPSDLRLQSTQFPKGFLANVINH